MKKWLCLVMAGILLLACTACDKKTALTEESMPIPEDAEFTIQNDMHAFVVVGTQTDGTGELEKTLTVYEKASGKLVQSIQLTANEWFTKRAIYLVDVSFDGHSDIIVPYSRPASAAFFQAYVWDKEQNKYIYAPYYENIPNIAIDTNNKLLLSHRTADKITSYSMYGYSAENGDIITVRSIYWEPQENLNAMLVQEFAYNNDGTRELLQQFNVSAIDSISIDRTDSQITPYFSNNSIWNLDSKKWNNLVIPISEYNY